MQANSDLVVLFLCFVLGFFSFIEVYFIEQPAKIGEPAKMVSQPGAVE